MRRWSKIEIAPPVKTDPLSLAAKRLWKKLDPELWKNQRDIPGEEDEDFAIMPAPARPSGTIQVTLIKKSE
jgi:hypothetical protein